MSEIPILSAIIISAVFIGFAILALSEKTGGTIRAKITNEPRPEEPQPD